jgi:DNA-directed RNA polymerase subunit RPC12/RpoP
MLNLVKKRIELNAHPTADAKTTAELLQEQFSKINNLSDLTTYRVWATKRNWKKAYSEVISHRPDGKKYVRTVSRVTDEFVPSMIDRISIVNEVRWFAALRRKENFLKGRIKLFAHLETVIKEVIPMDLPEISVTCPHRVLVKDKVAKRFVEKNCDCMAIGIPQFAVLQDGKGICFVQCEECGHKVWLLNQDESGSDIHTMEEWYERINQSI